MIENVLILDCETTGLNPKKDKLIEIACILYSVKYKAILQCFSTLFPCDENPVEHINGIKAEVTRINMPVIALLQYLQDILPYTNALVAHNAQFDKGFIKQIDCLSHNWPWICTKHDFIWPCPLKRFRLQDVCESMGIEYRNAHRAIQDCMFLVDCFNKVEDLQERMDQAHDKVINNV